MMETNILDKTLSKREKYEIILPQIKALVEGESNLVANLANVAAVLKESFDFFWVGFYIFDVDRNSMILGPFQGPVACTRINMGRGVCGKVFEREETIIVSDVNQFEDHISCNARSKSEIVVPVIQKNKVLAVLDVDSDQLNSFNLEDKEGLESIANLISEKF